MRFLESQSHTEECFSLGCLVDRVTALTAIVDYFAA